eukprot:TRINITY_DN12242_c0_g1_i1.p1 TRINITY_DN12242_c0_g1~~TRINITY_DN12242_c0_g1_i1.p1  ORF type:complete len:569 (+),score=179.37 TRINITY_DN12242_c0_g1_i1:85-1791(+)
MAVVPDLSFSVRDQTAFDELEASDEFDEHATELHEAVWDCDKEEVESILADAKKNKKLKKVLKRLDPDLRPPLVYAIVKKNTPITRMLIEAKADVNYTDPNDAWSPLFYAIWHGFREGVDLLLDAGADYNHSTQGEVPINPLQLACGLGDIASTVKLLKVGAPLKVSYSVHNVYQFNPLLIVIYCSDISEKLTRQAIGDMLINEGVDIQKPTRDGVTPLMCAIDRGQFETAKTLIDRAARADKEVNGYITAMYLAMLRGNVNLGKMIADAGGKVMSGKNKSTPLHAAVSSRNPACVEFLLENGHLPVPLDKDGWTPLHLAAVLDDPGPLAMLLEKNVNIEVPCRGSKLLALHCAALTGRTENCKLLVEKGANIEARDKKDGITPLIATFFNDHQDTCKYLLGAGASMMTRRPDDAGITPMVNAIALQRTEISNILCEQVFQKAEKSGFVKKRGGGHRSAAYKKRWFTLYGVYFLYFKTNKWMGEPQGIIELDGAKVVDVEDSKKQNEFQVVSTRRTFELQANTPAEKEDWMAALNATIKERSVEAPLCPSFSFEGKMPVLVGEEDSQG